ncbi:carbamoyl-phosphate synthase (glutamine-hydrolyzing) cpa2, partial [Coemansia erecta]
VAKHFASAGYPVLTDSESTAQMLAGGGVPGVKVVKFEYNNRRTLRDAVFESNIDMVVNLGKHRPTDKDNTNYAMRRMAVDFGIPLVNDQRCAEMLVDALEALPQGTATALYGSQKLNIETPVDVKSWQQYLDMRK